MALNISDLARMGEFNFELKSLGTVRCLSLKTNHISQANKKLASNSVDYLELVRWLFGELARRPAEGCSVEVDQTEAPRLAPEELSSVTDLELEEFAGKLIQKNRYLLKTHKGSDIEMLANESACDFLVHAFRHHATEEKAQWKRMIEPASKSLFAGATLEAMQRNLGLSDQFQDTINKYAHGHSLAEEILSASKLASGRAALEAMQRDIGLADQFRDAIDKCRGDLSVNGTNLVEPRLDELNYRMPDLHIPKNPIHETNEKLGNVVNQIEDLRPMAAQAAQLIRSMNDTALRMQADYINNARTSGQQTKIAIWIASISLVVSAIGLAISSFFSYQSYVDAKGAGEKGDIQVKAFQNEIRDLAVAQRDERAALVKAIVDVRRVSPAVVKKQPEFANPIPSTRSQTATP